MGSKTNRMIRKICLHLRRLHHKLCLHCQSHRQAWYSRPTFSFFERRKASAFSEPISTDEMLDRDSQLDQNATIRIASLNVAHFSRASAALIGKFESFQPENTTHMKDLCLHLKPNISYNPTFTPRSSINPTSLSNLFHNPIGFSPFNSNLTESFPFLDRNGSIESGFELSKSHCLNPTFSPWRDFHSSPRKLESLSGIWSILEVLREVNADLVALQEVKADEEKGMGPLSELAEALGMNYAYAESWAPEFGNAVLSRWPIKSWSVKRIHDDTDHRNVLKVVVNIPLVGEINFHCTHLDHLDEDWRLKQVKSLIEDTQNSPHILVGGLNSLRKSDYTKERWLDIAKLCEENGKPPPKYAVMEKLLNERGYIDAVSAAGEEDDIISVLNGQKVQGTCKYGTRVDYILASSLLPFQFVPGSYSVTSSKGTSDHQLVKVDIQKL